MSVQEIIDALWEKVIADLSGIIAIWSGAIVDIPEGWHLCDGDEGTVDLRDQFVICAGGSFNPDDSGGALTHDHDFTIAPHSHELTGAGNIAAGANFDETTTAVGLSGTTDAATSLPPYYALAFIQKI